jgi:lysophospholipase L1-like esterase
MKRALRALLRVGAILLLTLALAEGLFRIYAFFNPTFIFYGGSYNRFRATPLSYHYDFRMNSRGFKDVEFEVGKREGTYRILGLGDSFAYGIVPYQHNYYTVLEEGLKGEGRRVELINMGIGGTGPQDYLSLLVKEGLPLAPDMVIVSFFIGNDFSDATVDKSARPLSTYSYVATFVKYVIDVNRTYTAPAASANPQGFDVYDDDAPTFEASYFLDLEVGRSEIFREASPRFDEQFRDAVGYLRRIKEICAARHIALAVVIIPDEVQVNPALRAEVMRVKAQTDRGEHFDFALPDRRLGAWLQEQGIPYVQLLDEFVAEGRQRALYKPKDTHWNIAGNRLAATVIQRELFGPGQGRAARTPPPDLAMRAGPTVAPGMAPPAPPVAAASTYEGFHEETNCLFILGWAWDRRRPNEPMEVTLHEGGAPLATVKADRFRQDLLDAGKGNGAHAFEWPVPPSLRDGRPHQVSAKIAGTETALKHTPRQIRCSPG